MAISLKHLAAASVFALAAAAAQAPASAASIHEDHPKATAVLKAEKARAAKAARHKPARSARNKKAEPQPDIADDEPAPDITNTVVTDYACELNNKVTIYTNDQDSDHIALRWKNRLHRLERTRTTTGAQRFENPKFGLIWIGIPAKGILLDSKQNRQLANECKDAEQAKPIVAAVPADKKS